MVRVTPQQIVEVTGARLVCGPADREVEGVEVDSRRVPAGGLFVAFPGERVDGNDFAVGALEAGAAAVAVTREPDAGLLAAARDAGAAVLSIDDAEEFLLSLAAWWRDQLDCAVVGVTGSSGKTTTKEMVAAVLATTFKTHATRGNYNSLIGAPLTVLACPRDAEALVVEMGMNASGEIGAIAHMARPHIGVVTNVGMAHIGLLGSRLNIARAKAELVEALVETGGQKRYPVRALLWGEDDFTGWIKDQIAEPRCIRTLTFGTAEADDARCTAYSFDETGCATGEATLPSGAVVELALGMPGEHNLIDALAAAGVGDVLGVPKERIADALAAMRPIKMHQQVLKAPGGFTVIDDSYNANTDSMRRAVDVLCTLPVARRIACLGDMGELGDTSEVMHAVVGAYVAAKPVDVLVAVGPASRGMGEAARLMGMGEDNVVCVDSADAASAVLREILRPGDAVLVKASRSTGLDSCVEAVMGAWA